ncbi:hypothetical protein [Stieleria varia]|uniref:hypothetical protein n=1 Tax=Stieleria varia TaxID=2528005 RepID=UPI0011B5F4F9|nr:hypothetical protein [Stieleria varia]
MQPPAYVSLIHSEFVQLAGDVGSDLLVLEELGMIRSGSCWQIPFSQSNPSAFEDRTLIELVSQLRSLGVKFGEDFKQMCDPATYMRELRSRSALDGGFDTIAFRGPQDWIITTVP